MLKFEDRIIALRDQEIQELNETIISLRAAGHKLLDELTKAHAQIRSLKDQVEGYELAAWNADVLSLDLADALETIERLQSGEVRP